MTELYLYREDANEIMRNMLGRIWDRTRAELPPLGRLFHSMSFAEWERLWNETTQRICDEELAAARQAITRAAGSLA